MARDSRVEIMKKYYFMLYFSVFWAVAGVFAAGVYFGHGEHDNAIFCMGCALGNVMRGYVWHFQIVNKKINGNESK